MVLPLSVNKESVIVLTLDHLVKLLVVPEPLTPPVEASTQATLEPVDESTCPLEPVLPPASTPACISIFDLNFIYYPIFCTNTLTGFVGTVANATSTVFTPVRSTSAYTVSPVTVSNNCTITSVLFKA